MRSAPALPRVARGAFFAAAGRPRCACLVTDRRAPVLLVGVAADRRRSDEVRAAVVRAEVCFAAGPPRREAAVLTGRGRAPAGDCCRACPDPPRAPAGVLVAGALPGWDLREPAVRAEPPRVGRPVGVAGSGRTAPTVSTSALGRAAPAGPGDGELSGPGRVSARPRSAGPAPRRPARQLATVRAPIPYTTQTHHTTNPRPGTRAPNRKIAKPARNAPSRELVRDPRIMSRPRMRAVVTYPSGVRTVLVPSTASPSGMPTTVVMTATPMMGATIPTRSPVSSETPTRRPATTTESAARGNSHTNSSPMTADDTVTATQSNTRRATTNPVKMLATSSVLTCPCTVPAAALGFVREVMSPRTSAPGFTVTFPLTTVTSPSTSPVTMALPSSTSTLPSMRPETVRSPCPTTTSSFTRPSMMTGPSTDTAGPSIDSPGATTSPPVTVMRIPWVLPPPPRAAAGIPVLRTQTQTSTSAASTRRRMQSTFRPCRDTSVAGRPLPCNSEPTCG